MVLYQKLPRIRCLGLFPTCNKLYANELQWTYQYFLLVLTMSHSLFFVLLIGQDLYYQNATRYACCPRYLLL